MWSRIYNDIIKLYQQIAENSKIGGPKDKFD